jgi:UDP-N-acetylglucosamine--N-acetylmuramyl-(pentapeptide) pyrophosphoryl-undecaprenol N-acetylglucosamine transferase
MLLLPLRGSGTRGDQVENASFFEQAGAAKVLCDGTNQETLARIIAELAENKEMRVTMEKASAKIGDKNGALIIARAIAEIFN